MGLFWCSTDVQPGFGGGRHFFPLSFRQCQQALFLLLKTRSPNDFGMLWNIHPRNMGEFTKNSNIHVIGNRGAHLEPKYTGCCETVRKWEDEEMKKQSSSLGLNHRSQKYGRTWWWWWWCCKVSCFSFSWNAAIKHNPHLNMLLTAP